VTARERPARVKVNTAAEPLTGVAEMIRKALTYIPPERLILSSDCGFRREGLSRRIALFKCVALVQGANVVRRELGLPEALVRAANARLALG
jgi:5-methyltetrahydropteroyltriglutamate--homocysteine methyltransferase